MVSDRSSSNAGVRIVCRAVRGKGVAADTLLTTQCNTKVQTLLMLGVRLVCAAVHLPFLSAQAWD